MSTISIIAALSENNAIGKKQQLLWHMPYDMKRFKELTTGHAVVMGRKTFESLPKGALPNRKNIVLTTLPEAGFVDCFACESMHDALDICEKEDEIFMIGGAMVYKQALEIADKMYLTRVHHVFEDADTFFPEINFDEWEEIECQQFSADEKHIYPYTFLTYIRKK
ncbi:dihydrofolate reductase [Parabacteroides sp. PF5-9]|uniref:dihydrofolate reductase n=1 Tax=Parabacteroides sp. PF5-9 TaxID=1742404 RepID=UPI0024733144|nr:dihydrofolate reductase [Parabacteroides sp. PF5-9]MDH6357122.1 dihydrofolate reductase [Parabacteroides sp. PF5-9]